MVDHLVRQDTDHPGAQRRAALELAGLRDGGEERLLHQIARELGIARGAQRESVQHRLELAELELGDRGGARGQAETCITGVTLRAAARLTCDRSATAEPEE